MIVKNNKIIILFIVLFVLLSFPKTVFSQGEESNSLKEAMFYKQLEKNKIQCRLCPRRCKLTPGQVGFCRSRKNVEGKLYSRVYGKVVSAHVDPIEKKPLFHFLPSSKAFSIATTGCNLRCKFCQNWQISQQTPEEVSYVHMTPQEVVKKAIDSGADSIAFTYNEPIIFYEYMLEIAKLAKEKGLHTLMITNGYINEKPLRKLCKYMDAANVDLKGFNEQYYQKVTLGKLKPVLKTLKIMKEEGVWIEITNLMVPTLNDNPEEIRKMCNWIKKNLGLNVPLHFSRFTPMYKLKNLSYTPVKTLEKAVSIAKEVGLHYVYLGNLPGHKYNSTFCPNCGKRIIHRVGFQVLTENIENGKCGYCGYEISGKW